MTILVTGSVGFIGANFVLDWLAINDEMVVEASTLSEKNARGASLAGAEVFA